MAREFLEHFYFRGIDGAVENSGGGTGTGYCGGPTGATTPDENDTYNNNHFQNQLTRSLNPVSTGSNENNNTSTDMVDAMKKKWVRLQANIDNMFQGFGFSQPFNRRREGAVVAGGGEGRCGVGGSLTPNEKRRNDNLHLHHSNNHRRHSHWAEHDDTHLNSSNSDAVVVYQEQIEMALLSQGELRLGVGHDFVLELRSNPTWCDKCGDFIWGAYKQCLKCKRKSIFMKIFRVRLKSYDPGHFS
ncbi:uncharacterized protein LOC118763816 [Octopus sinensis]|uniref:Uncharacterized protein LOC118763816 n=1 Tax=Octopus sinensis TaxID=2607531 RepID=A0A7E6EXQ0_9MOLL|nr:uncharacterized protein LOC118763816 [Octopus sinensis]